MASDAVERIKERLSIVDVIAPYVELHSAGKNMKGKSPFTTEKTPSFYVSPDRGMYYCFSSSQGGDMFTFIEKMEGVDFKGALKILAEKAGVELVPEDPKKRTERDGAYSVLEEATRFFESELPKNAEAMKYLEERAVKPETIQKWRIGYVPGPPTGGWRHTREHLQKSGFKDEEMVRVGLVKSADKGKEPYDTFRDRIMFPIMDASGRVVGYSGRILHKDDNVGKYINSPETELFNKSEILFGYDKAKNNIRHFDFSLIVEGQFDVVLAHQAGYSNTVAVSGTALTPHHVSLLQRLSNRVVLALDADRAGISAVKRASDIMLPRGIDVKVAELPEGKDPADMVATDPKEFKHIIGSAKHVIEFLLAVLKRESKDERTYKLRAREEILPYLLKIESHIDREHFVSRVAEALNTTTDAVRQELSRMENEAGRVDYSNYEEASQNTKDAKQEKNSTRKNDLFDCLLVAGDFIEGDFYHALAAEFAKVTESSISESKKNLPTEKESEIYFRLEQSWNGMSDKQRRLEITDMLNELNTIIVKEKISVAKEKLNELEKAGDEAGMNECLGMISSLQKNLSEITLLE